MNRSTLCSWRVWLIFFKKRTIDKIVRSTHFCERQVVWVGPHWEYTRLTTDEQPRGFSGITPIFTFVRSFSHSVNGTSFLRLYTRKCKNKAKKKKNTFSNWRCVQYPHQFDFPSVFTESISFILYYKKVFVL